MELNQNQTLGDGSKTLGQIMTPVQDPDYDSNSLKRSEFFQFFKKGGQKLLKKAGLNTVVWLQADYRKIPCNFVYLNLLE